MNGYCDAHSLPIVSTDGKCLECYKNFNTKTRSIGIEEWAQLQERIIHLESQLTQIRTRCPSCGSQTLFIGTGGHLTCSLIGCKEPVVERAITAVNDKVEKLRGALEAFIKWRSGPEGPEVLFPEGAALHKQIKQALTDTEGK